MCDDDDDDGGDDALERETIKLKLTKLHNFAQHSIAK
jgi:hypothetical protein